MSSNNDRVITEQDVPFKKVTVPPRRPPPPSNNQQGNGLVKSAIMVALNPTGSIIDAIVDSITN